MRVYFDYQIFALQKFGGISRYFIELAEKLKDISKDIQTTIVAPLYVNKYLQTCSAPTWGQKVIEFPGKHHILPIINRLSSSYYLNKVQPHIIHETYYTDKPLRVNVPRILTVYDMIHERFPQYFTGVDLKIPSLKANAVKRADHIIAISNATRNDLITLLRVPEKKISVIPLASSFNLNEPKMNNRIHSRPYLLYVGLRGGVKNFSILLKAYSQSSRLRSRFDLICVGGGQFSSSEKNIIIDAGLEKSLYHYSADDGELTSLYGNATVFIYPSLYEGFGLPLLEAMRCGCPIVCSKTSSMPEIAGDAAAYFDPEDGDALCHTLEQVTDSLKIQQTLRRQGHERQKLFTWEKCVGETAKLYDSLL